MKVIIYSIPTANGLIAEENEKNYDFISDKSWEDYLEKLKEAGVFVMGAGTFKASLRTGAFPYPCLNVIMTSQKVENKWRDKALFTNLNPKEVLKLLEEKGFKEVVVTGGHLSSSFMKENLVDELWIDLMPEVFSRGINLFEGESFNSKLKLIKINKSDDGGVQLRYKVIK